MPAERWDIDWDEVGLGQRCDADIAHEVGVNSSTVATHRRRRGIVPFGRVPQTCGASAFGLYFLGLFPDACSCEVGWCRQQNRCVHAVFLLRGHVIALELCEPHGKMVETWADTHHPDVVKGLVKALRRPAMLRELGYARA
jgi:hypothetical protein